MSKLEDLKTEFRNMEKIPVITIIALNTLVFDNEPIDFSLSIEGDSIMAQHQAMTEEEENSDKISHFLVELDDSFSLDENLQAVCEKAFEVIHASDVYDYPHTW